MMKTEKKILCVLLSLLLLLPVLTAGPVSAAANAQGGAAASEIYLTDAFGDELFSNAALDRFLTLFPRLCALLDALPEEMRAQWTDAVQTAFSGENPFSNGGAQTYLNGEDGAATAEDFLSSMGQRLYPASLGAYLCDRGCSAAGSALKQAESWDAFLNDGAYDFGFDWGVDAIGDPGARYAAFVHAFGTLLDAAPVLKTVFCGTGKTLSFGADADFCHVEVQKTKVKIMFITLTIGTVYVDAMSGTVCLSGGGYYQSHIVPAYRCLGLGSVVPCSFTAPVEAMPGNAMAKALFDPLYTLVRAVQSSPETCVELVRFYEGEAGTLLDALPENGGMTAAGTLKVNDFEISNDTLEQESLIADSASIREGVENAARGALAGCLEYDFRFALDPFASAGGLKAYLTALLPGLVYECGHVDVIESVDESCHIVRCIFCSRSYIEPHLIYVTDVVPPTCVSDGYTTYSCAVCGDTRAETVPKTDHMYELTGSTPPTCTADGVNTYTCSGCGDTRAETVPKTDHTYELTGSTPPTCTADGVITYTCFGCGDTRAETVPALGHTEANDQGKCGRCGEQLIAPCRLCGKIHTGTLGSIIAALHELIYRLTHLF